MHADGVKGGYAPLMMGLKGPCPLDAESSAIGCNAELNEIKIILISVFKHPININGLRGLRGLRLCLLLRGVHIAVGFACN